MKNCPNCKTAALEGARFCHQCGTNLSVLTQACSDCAEHNPIDAKFCKACGNNFVLLDGSTLHTYETKYPLDYNKSKQVLSDIRQFFIDHLRKILAEEQSLRLWSDYLDHFYQTDFKHRFELRAAQLSKEAQELHLSSHANKGTAIDQLFDEAFDQLADFFIIKYCPDLNEVQLPEEILKYEKTHQSYVNVEEMIFDFIDLPTEEKRERYFTDFITIDPILLKNAVKSFLSPAQKEERMLFLFDQTVFGSCKEGFAMTDKGIYWKVHFNKSRFVHYDNIKEVLKEKDWITINGHYFHVNRSMNLKMKRLLLKLQKVFSA